MGRIKWAAHPSVDLADVFVDGLCVGYIWRGCRGWQTGPGLPHERGNYFRRRVDLKRWVECRLQKSNEPF